MATVYYLNWDQPENDAEQDFFHEAHFNDTEIDGLNKDWYREVAEVNTIEREKIWNAFQGGVPIDTSDEQMRELKTAFQEAEERSMSVGDVVTLGGEPHIVRSIGFEKTEWEK